MLVSCLLAFDVLTIVGCMLCDCLPMIVGVMLFDIGCFRFVVSGCLWCLC